MACPSTAHRVASQPDGICSDIGIAIAVEMKQLGRANRDEDHYEYPEEYEPFRRKIEATNDQSQRERCSSAEVYADRTHQSKSHGADRFHFACADNQRDCDTDEDRV